MWEMTALKTEKVLDVCWGNCVGNDHFEDREGAGKVTLSRSGVGASVRGG
jgi:hypothetical protein